MSRLTSAKVLRIVREGSTDDITVTLGWPGEEFTLPADEADTEALELLARAMNEDKYVILEVTELSQ